MRIPIFTNAKLKCFTKIKTCILLFDESVLTIANSEQLFFY